MKMYHYVEQHEGRPTFNSLAISPISGLCSRWLNSPEVFLSLCNGISLYLQTVELFGFLTRLLVRVVIGASKLFPPMNKDRA